MRIWNSNTGAELHRLTGHQGSVATVRFSPGEKLLLTSGKDGVAILSDPQSGNELIRLVSAQDNSWIVVAPDGRFDTAQLEAPEGVHWAMPGDLLHPLPPEIFMRDYYEPRLLPRCYHAALLKVQSRATDVDCARGSFAPVRALADLNRIQPVVRIKSVGRGWSADEAVVDVQVLAASMIGTSQTARPTPMRVRMIYGCSATEVDSSLAGCS